MPNQQPDSPADEIIGPTEIAKTSTRFVGNYFVQIRLAVLVCMLTLLLTYVSSQAYQRYVQLIESRHVFYSTTGESFAVIASDQQRTLASFVVPNRSGVALPEEPFEVSVEASLRLGYRKWIYPSRWNFHRAFCWLAIPVDSRGLNVFRGLAAPQKGDTVLSVAPHTFGNLILFAVDITTLLL